MKNIHAIRFGILAGIGTVVILFLFYWIDKKLMLSPSIIWSTNILYIIGMFMAPMEVRKENGGYLDFRESLKAAFLVFLIANGIYYLFNFVLYNFIDPEMLDIQKQFMLENFTILEDALSEKNLDFLREGVERIDYKLSTVIMGYLTSLFWGFIFAALVGRWIRRNPIV